MDYQLWPQIDSAWAYPEAGSIKMNLEDVYKDHGRFKKRSTELKKWICENFKEDNINEQYVQQITSVLPDVENLNSWLDELEVATIE